MFPLGLKFFLPSGFKETFGDVIFFFPRVSETPAAVVVTRQVSFEW